MAPFPIVIGGSISYSLLYQIDFDAFSNRIAAVGDTTDTGMSINIVGGFSPFISVYQGPLMNYLWGKSLGVNDNYVGVAFSEDGINVVAITESSRTISIFKAIDGTLID